MTTAVRVSAVTAAVGFFVGFPMGYAVHRVLVVSEAASDRVGPQVAVTRPMDPGALRGAAVAVSRAELRQMRFAPVGGALGDVQSRGEKLADLSKLVFSDTGRASDLARDLIDIFETLESGDFARWSRRLADAGVSLAAGEHTPEAAEQWKRLNGQFMSADLDWRLASIRPVQMGGVSQYSPELDPDELRVSALIRAFERGGVPDLSSSEIDWVVLSVPMSWWPEGEIEVVRTQVVFSFARWPGSTSWVLTQVDTPQRKREGRRLPHLLPVL